MSKATAATGRYSVELRWRQHECIQNRCSDSKGRIRIGTQPVIDAEIKETSAIGRTLLKGESHSMAPFNQTVAVEWRDCDQGV